MRQLGFLHAQSYLQTINVLNGKLTEPMVDESKQICSRSDCVFANAISVLILKYWTGKAIVKSRDPLVCLSRILSSLQDDETIHHL